MKRERMAKVVIIGEARVGKTSLLTRYTDGNFHENMIPTLGIDYRLKRLDVDGMEMKIQIWDTAGQERFRSITQNFYKGAMGIVLVFDVNDPSTLENLKTWLESIKVFQTQDVVKVIFANKSDLEQKVTSEQIKEIEDINGIPVFIVSAKTNSNIDEAVLYLARQVKRLYFDDAKRTADNDAKIFEDLDNSRSNIKQEQERNKSKCC